MTLRTIAELISLTDPKRLANYGVDTELLVQIEAGGGVAPVAYPGCHQSRPTRRGPTGMARSDKQGTMRSSRAGDSSGLVQSGANRINRVRRSSGSLGWGVLPSAPHPRGAVPSNHYNNPDAGKVLPNWYWRHPEVARPNHRPHSTRITTTNSAATSRNTSALCEPEVGEVVR
jgi:hypothetical protein